MKHPQTSQASPPERSRDRGIELLEQLERRIAEYEADPCDRLLEIAEAEERGAWPLAARLRRLRRGGR